VKYKSHYLFGTHILKERSEGGNTVKNDIYGEPVIIEKNNIIARVRSPILTEDEYNSRMEQIKQAAIRLLLSKED
jgi:hypothetical protein